MDYNPNGTSYMHHTYSNTEISQWATQEPHAPYATIKNSHSMKFGRSLRPTSAPVKSEYAQMRRPPSSSYSMRDDDSGIYRPPFAPRKTDAMFTHLGHGKGGSLPSYNPLHDPHLHEFYERRFGRMVEDAERLQRFRHDKQAHRVVLRKQMKERGKSSSKMVLYKVAVTTGDQKGSGTDARVFLRVNGTKGKLPKTRLYKLPGKKDDEKEAFKFSREKPMTAAAKKQREKAVPFKFSKGTTHVFKVKAADFGEIKSIHLEHDGLGKQHSWYLESVEIINTANKKSWFFRCAQWLSLHVGDCQNSRELFAKKSAKTEYEIIVVTGDVIGSGTNANVFLTIHGKSGVTPKMHLKDTSKRMFERNQSDIFVMKANCVGPMTKVRIQHDNTGKYPGWYVERVVITDLKHPKWKYFFPCGQWLSRTEGDGSICRDLLGSQDPLAQRKASQYRVTVFTGNVRGAGTDANVHVCLFGDQGESTPKRLDKTGNNFERGKKDEFMISCPAVGKIQRIRIGHDNSGPSPGWFLDKVIVDDLELNRVYEFPCQRWFAKDEDDGKLSRELVHGIGIDDAVPGIPYQIRMTTGDVRLAATSARVFIILYGGKDGEENSGKIWLDNGQFQRGKTDIFDVEVVKMLMPLTRIDVGHDNSGPGPGWYLDKAVISCPSAGIEQTFLCNKWFALDEGDGVIERTLYEQKTMRKEQEKKITWFVRVYTSNMKNAGTDANVNIVVYGFGKKKEVLKSDVVPLKAMGDMFESGQCDKFKISMCEIGTPFKLRVGHDNHGTASGWHLERIEMENMVTKKKYSFNCKRWLARGEDDWSIVREMSAEGTDVKKPVPLTKYDVEVYTGNKMAAGTDANVFLNIYGEQGDTGDRDLVKSSTHRNKFERAKMDKFEIEACDLKQLKKIRIGHDGKNPGAGWYLNKVVIQEANHPETKVTFDVNRWLAFDEDDGAIVREITAQGAQGLTTTSYHVHVKTGECKNAGTDSNVHVQLFGSSGDTGKLFLKSADNNFNKFERGRTDLFKLEAADIGKIWRLHIGLGLEETIEKLRVGHDSFLASAGWFLDEVRVDIPSRGEYYRFACHRWLDKGEMDGKTEIDIEPSEMREGQISIPYEVTVWTGDKSGAGTDSNVFLQMYGEKGKTEEFQLRNRTDNFEKNQIDKFKIEAADIGHLLKVRIGHDGTGPLSGWYLNKLMIQRHFIKQTAVERRKAQMKKKHSTLSRMSRSGFHDDEDDDPRAKPGLRRQSSMTSLGDKEFERYWFVCNKWFAKSEGDGLIVRELLPTTEDGKVLNTGLEEVEYEVRVRTGDKLGAGTDANVFITIAGEIGDTGERQLRKSNNINKFEKSQVDIFKLPAIDLGPLKKVKIRHDNKGGGAAWFLDYVEIDDPKGKQNYFFPCQRWMATDEDDGQVARELVPVDPSIKSRLQGKGSDAVRKEIAFVTKAHMNTYHVNVTTGDVWGAGTDSNVYIYLFGDKDDTGKVLLKSSLTHKNKFERNQTDEFVVEAVDIGELQKIRVGHDGAGGGAAWYLDKVEIDCPSLGRRWLFPCGRWMGKGEDDGLLERELLPQEMATEEYIPCVPYEIVTYTSNISGASTDADVYIVVYGKELVTQQKTLCVSKQERKKSFKKGQVDKFVLELEDIGEPIEKIRIGHDDSGFASGWHLDRVDVKKLKTKGSESSQGATTYTFPCGRWLARSEEDGAIARELVAGSIVEETMKKDGTVRKKEINRKNTLVAKNYEIDVYTGDVKGGGTDANVFLTLHGDKGDSGERKLVKSDTHMDKFERNQLDKFKFEAVDLGKLYKAKIRHDNSMLNPSWFLDRIEVRDTKDNEKYVFHCERWLAKNKDDGKIDRAIYVKGYEGDMSSTSTLHSTKIGSITSLDSFRSGEPFSKSPKLSKKFSSIEEMPEGPTVPYTVKVQTGEGQDCGTDSSVWVRIIGPKKKHTGRLFLELVSQKRRFEPSSVNTFSLEAVDVDLVKKIEIGHDGVTPGSGWFVKEVEIDMPTKGKHYFFNCHAWLAKDKGDGKTTRLFAVEDGESTMTTYKPKIPYELTVVTGDMHGAGTDAQLAITVFGMNGTSGELNLDKSEHRFERGKTDLIKIEIDDIAPLKKIRIGHNGKGSRVDWYLEKATLRNMNTGDLTVFNCNKWFSKTKEDNLMVRDIPATIRGVEQVKRTDYKINVKTSDVRGAGTDANVFVVIFGENGDSGEIHLAKSETFKSPFENNQLDVFTYKGLLSLGELSKLRVWHDNKGIGAAWHLNYIEVEDLGKRDKKFMFPCNKWLSRSEDDRQTCRELTCANAKKPTASSKSTYDIVINTSDKQQAGMIHNAWLILQGELRNSEEFVMENSAKNKILRRGQTDSFKLPCKNLGKIKKCILGAVEREDRPIPDDAEGRDVMWHCHDVTVIDTNLGNKYTFKCQQWITICEDIDHKYAKKLEVKDVEENKVSMVRQLAAVKYEIVVVTGDIKGAGTDANVTVCVFGEHGDSGKRPLKQKFRDLFERGQTDKFQIETLDLGELNKVKIEHDNSGFGAGWFLERVEIINMASNKRWTFPCQQWLDKKKGDGEICREIFVKD
ncbi:lipoxygenase homology domain-containing protein 1-like isoform X3 [Lineus longissimus]|uniref:lipoxygenase homology domain-containing protein 1-like isoform X3 n=1 Tax=Lineus longissimus TaxID=88925 RepID=UPI00315DCF22